MAEGPGLKGQSPRSLYPTNSGPMHPGPEGPVVLATNPGARTRAKRKVATTIGSLYSSLLHLLDSCRLYSTLPPLLNSVAFTRLWSLHPAMLPLLNKRPTMKLLKYTKTT